MEHIVQFAISIDDQTIAKRIEDNAEEQIIKQIEQQVRNGLFEHYYGRDADEQSGLNRYSKEIVENFLEKHKEEILEKAAIHLSDKLVRTKAGKALLEDNEQAAKRSVNGRATP